MNLKKSLRIHAVTHSLFSSGTLNIATDQLGFIQADPIRSPARAQDLILRHRVKGYRAGDLERQYADLDIEEDYLYAYGFVHRNVWKHLHPRQTSRISSLEKKVLDAVHREGEMHPAALETHFGLKRVINAWGGYSKATTRALDHLHYRGLLRVARRENGIRVYELTTPLEPLPPADRLRKLILRIVSILTPVPMQTLHSNIARFRRLGNPRAAVRDLIHEGVLEYTTVDGISYVWQPRNEIPGEVPGMVRFLAPFDPVVWDRRRFEHLWGWPYRFEAYTPPAKRIRGYYAMPMLWADNVIGWANAGVVDAQLNVDVGFVKRRPRDPEFSRELDAEIGRLKNFLHILH